MSQVLHGKCKKPGLTAVLVTAALAGPARLDAQILAPGEVDLSHVVVTRDVDYVPDREYADGRDRLDIFMPRNAQSVPVVVFFHGGALRAGDKVDGEALAARLAPEGIGVVTANYRLSPEVTHPAHVEDAARAYAWVTRNIERFGGNSESVYVSGHSAGAYLAALLALDSTHLARRGVAFTAIRGAALVSPFLYVEETAPDRPKDVWGSDPSTWVAASVTAHIQLGARPLLLIFADGDEEWRKDQIQRFGRAMSAVGHRHITVRQVPNRDHISFISRLMEDDDEIRNALVDFIQEIEAR